MDRGAWWTTVHWGCKDSDMTEYLHTHTHTRTHACACTHTDTHTDTHPEFRRLGIFIFHKPVRKPVVKSSGCALLEQPRKSYPTPKVRETQVRW